MASLIAGLAFMVFGVCLVADFSGVARRIYDFYASFMNPGRATPKTIRLVGVFITLVGVGWVGTSFPLG
ncbi:hypothetical protein ABTZ78_03310 [Streptomyces bauhiniae]|uniref:hypothetical protein n=1 Tax=Streptomyces bauhiniae TaxID=2340725 RepID=UPI003317E3B9